MQNTKDQPITKEDLNQILDHKLNQWTQNSIAPAVELMFDKLEHKLGGKFENMENRFENMEKEIKKNRADIKISQDKILTSNDKLASEIKKDREEFMATVINSKHAAEKFSSHDKTLANHESRLKTLESQPA